MAWLMGLCCLEPASRPCTKFCQGMLVSYADGSILYLQTAVGMAASPAYSFTAMKDVCVGVADHLSSMMPI